MSLTLIDLAFCNKKLSASKSNELICNIREAILSLPIGELLAKLKTDQLQPLEVLQAYQAKALSVNDEINAVCDFILEATEQAEALATLTPEERGPLYGLPISVKVTSKCKKNFPQGVFSSCWLRLHHRNGRLDWNEVGQRLPRH